MQLPGFREAGSVVVVSCLVAPHMWSMLEAGSVVVVSCLVAPHMWDLPGPGIELVSPALAGRFFTTEPPEKPR